MKSALFLLCLASSFFSLQSIASQNTRTSPEKGAVHSPTHLSEPLSYSDLSRDPDLMNSPHPSLPQPHSIHAAPSPLPASEAASATAPGSEAASDPNLGQVTPPPLRPVHMSPRLKSTWEVCGGCAQPESVYFNPLNSMIYVSNVGGEPKTKNGLGTISKLSVDGKIIKKNFVTGLDAPKGMRAANGKLYVTDIDRVVVINQKSGRIERKIPFRSAKFLNDIAIDANGTIYVSDTEGSAIYSWSRRKGVRTVASGKYLECPNGLLVVGNSLIIASWGVMAPDWSTKVPGKLMAFDLKTEEIKVFTKQPFGNLDGLERLDQNHFLVSDWVAGKVFIVSKSGESEEILSGLNGAADIGWIPSKRLLLVPRMNENLISAFKLH